jgi:hypothetical protein
MQTAVDYLEEIIYGDKEFSLSEVFEQAKEIERVNIIQAFQYGDSLGYYDLADAEQYYNETFKSE